MLGSAEATATMSRATRRSPIRSARLGPACSARSATSRPDDADIADLRALLYGLQAVLRLHTAQEDESYLSLTDKQARPEASGQLTA